MLFPQKDNDDDGIKMSQQNVNEVIVRGGLLCLADAIRVFETAGCRNEFKDPPVDLLCVVVSVDDTENWNENNLINGTVRRPNKFFRLGIHDQSIDNLSTASITCRLNNTHAIVNIGDIVRFNRVSLPNGFSNMHNNSNNNNTTIYRFQYSRYDPEIGDEYYRLGHVDENGSFIPDVTMNDENVQLVPSNSSLVSDLVSWYKTSSFFKQQQMTYLSKLPCRFRSLNEIRECTGIISHVVAEVTDVQYDPDRTMRFDKISKKRKRGNTRSLGTPIYANLTDGRGNTMTFFIDSSNEKRMNYLSIFQKSINEKRKIMFSYIQSNRLVSTDEVVLIPTAYTTLALIDHENNKRENDEVSFTSNPLPSMTEGIHLTGPSQAVPSETFLAIVGDIFLKNVSLRNSYEMITNSQQCLDDWNMLFRKDPSSLEYTNDVEIILYELIDRGNANTRSTPERRVKGNATILQTLCGGLVLEEWHGNTSTAVTYRNLVTKLIYGILLEQIQFYWTVEISDDGTNEEVTSVTIPRL